MKRPAWLRKPLLLIPLLALVLGMAALVALRIYLSTGRATGQVAERLRKMLGGRVEVHEAKIGLIGDSTVQGIEVYEDGQQEKPWIRIDGVKADVSVLSLLRDKSPDDIQLDHARIGLRFSNSGHMLTKLPSHKGATGPIPRLHIEQGELTLDQEGQPAMVIQGINADIVSGPDGLTLTGTITDPFWGNWKANGDFDTSGSKGSITLDTPQVEVTMQKLRSIAFVPPKVWREVHVEGMTPGKVRLDLKTGDKTKVHYRVEIAPRDARVQVPSIDLDAQDATGKAIIEDELVTLEDVRGKIARGDIMTSGDLNFRGEISRLVFKVGVKDVALHQLPRSWKIPKQIDGRLTGSANLDLTIQNGKVKTKGSGEGTINHATFAGFPVKNTIRLALESEGGGRFRFKRKDKNGAVAQEAPHTEARAIPAITADRFVAAVVGLEGAVDEGAGGLAEWAPARLPSLLGQGINWGIEKLSQGLDKTTRGLSKLNKPTKPGEEPTYLDVDLNLENVEVAQLIQRLKLQLPYQIAGRLTIQVHASIPVNTAGDMKAYRFRGTAKLPTFTIAGLEMTNVEAKAKYADGVLDLEDLRGQMPTPPPPFPPHARGRKGRDGTFQGAARVQIVPQGDLWALVKINQIPLDVVLNLLPGAKDQASGVLSGRVEGRVPVKNLRDPASWRGSAALTSPNILVYGMTLQNASADLVVDRAKATLTSLKADLQGTPITGDGELQLEGDYPFKSALHLGRTDLATLNRLAPSFRPPIEIKGHTQLNGSVTGTLNPFKLDTSGQLEARDLVAEGFKVDSLSFRWVNAKDGLKLEAIKAALYGGSITGSAVVPLSATAVGTAKLDIRDLDAAAVAKSLPSFPVRLEGKVSGTVNGELNPSVSNHPREWTTDIELAAPRLRVQGVPAEKLKGSIDSHGGKTSYNLRGESLGGTFTIKGDLPSHAKDKKQAEPPRREGPEVRGEASELVPVASRQEQAGQGRIDVRGAQLSRLWDAYNIRGGLARLDGTFSVDLPYRHEGPRDLPVGNGVFRIVDVTWDDAPLSDRLQGDLRLTHSQLMLNNISGDLDGGLFLGRFVFGLTGNQRSYYSINLQQVDASRLLAPLPALAANVRGPIDAHFRGSINSQWDGSGEVALTRGQIFGMDITEWRIPMQFAFSPAQGSGEVTVRDSAAQLAQGRARVNVALGWGNGLRLNGTITFFQVDLRTLLRHHPSLSSYASGRVSGRIDLAGSEMRSASDLTALVQAKLQQGQALQLPVLRQITPYLRPGVSATTFQSDQLKGRLAHGVFTIQHLTLVGELLQLFIHGTLNLAGNLDLDVTAQTGLCLNLGNGTNALRSRIPVIGAIPRVLLYEASSLLANRVVHLKVTGTVRSPNIHLEPILLLTEEAIRFFLGRLTSLPIPTVP
jgi:hypothetical protein